MKFIASFFGVNFDGEKNNMEKPKTKDGFIPFGDPKDYEKMSDDEKKAMTQKMMKVHKSRLAPGRIHPGIRKGKRSFS